MIILALFLVYISVFDTCVRYKSAFPLFFDSAHVARNSRVFCGATYGLVSVTMYCINRRSPSSVCVCVRACVCVGSGAIIICLGIFYTLY